MDAHLLLLPYLYQCSQFRFLAEGNFCKVLVTFKANIFFNTYARKGKRFVPILANTHKDHSITTVTTIPNRHRSLWLNIVQGGLVASSTLNKVHTMFTIFRPKGTGQVLSWQIFFEALDQFPSYIIQSKVSKSTNPDSESSGTRMFVMLLNVQLLG